jgi:hypothetical protein
MPDAVLPIIKISEAAVGAVHSGIIDPAKAPIGGLSRTLARWMTLNNQRRALSLPRHFARLRSKKTASSPIR